METQPAVDRYLASPSLSEATRRAYGFDLRAFSQWLAERGTKVDEVDVRVLSDWATELGRSRNGFAPATIARKLSAVRAFLRFTLGPARVPDRSLAPRRGRRLPDAPKPSEIEALLDAVEGDEPLALRNRALLDRKSVV